MAWSANLTVDKVSGNTVSLSGMATGTDDDSTVSQVSVTLTYSEVPAHVAVGNVVELTANC